MGEGMLLVSNVHRAAVSQVTGHATTTKSCPGKSDSSPEIEKSGEVG